MEQYLIEIVKCPIFGYIGLRLLDLDLSQFIKGDFSVLEDPEGIAHDLTEHVNSLSLIGDVNDEFEALGAVVHTRIQFDDLLRYHSYNGFSNAEQLAYEVVRMSDFGYGEAESQPPCKYEDLLEEMLAYCREELEDSEEYLETVLNGMRLGIFKQQVLYPDAMVANTRFWNIANAIRPYMGRGKRRGQRLQLTIANITEVVCERVDRKLLT